MKLHQWVKDFEHTVTLNKYYYSLYSVPISVVLTDGLCYKINIRQYRHTE